MRDPDGRWMDENGHIIDTTGQTYGFLGASFKPKYATNFLGVNPGDGGGGGNYTPFGQTQAYADLMDSFQNKEKFSLKVENGYMTWWTDGDEPGYNGFVNGEIEIGVKEIIIHNMKLYERDQFWDGLTKIRTFRFC
jgi:hypothetical protein